MSQAKVAQISKKAICKKNELNESELNETKAELQALRQQFDEFQKNLLADTSKDDKLKMFYFYYYSVAKIYMQ